MIDFPNSPTVGQQFTAAGVTWTWDGTKWTGNGLNTPYLPLAGGTLSGPLTLVGNPVAPLQPATKQYVDYIEAAYPLGDNRIINGDMFIDQRNNGAAGTAVNAYTVDRWAYSASQVNKGTWQRNPSAAPGFPYYLGFTSTSAYTSVAGDNFNFVQPIEADMVSDFAWGTANAQPATLSFWVYSSLSGTFGGAINNSGAPATRSYPFTFALTANTWTKIAITIPGDTGGAWVMAGNAAGLTVVFDLGCGSTYRGPAGAWASANYWGANGAVSVVATNLAFFYLTGVKLEIGTVATPYNRQSITKRLADCQRYFWTIPSAGNFYYLGLTTPNFSWSSQPTIMFPVTMRSSPTMLNAVFTTSSPPAGTPAYGAVTPQCATINNPSNNWTQGNFSATVALSAQFIAEL
jgi:hypothetical protein